VDRRRQGLVPHSRSTAAGTGPEKRLAYVAVTRAGLTLYVSWTRDRGRQREPSRYVSDLARLPARALSPQRRRERQPPAQPE
jgi:superfamily I DNA/RNA helicase